VLDTTGAGDLFAAGFLFGYTRDLPLDECAKLGAIAAAEVISHVGPRPLLELRTLLPSSASAANDLYQYDSTHEWLDT